MDIMKGVNAYFRKLTKKEIDSKEHRDFVGGFWDELGLLQLDFLVKNGLEPGHTLLDIGCGCLRGGVHFVKYLESTKYYGLDINASLIEAGKNELKEAGLSHKKPNLIVDEKFSFNKFQMKFDFMISVSVFTHLPMNIIIRCLTQVRENLSSNGVYYATFFEAPVSSHIESIKQNPGGIVTNFDSDPFHYSVDEMAFLAKSAGLNLEIIGDWSHPRNQKMAAFTISH